MSTFVEPLAHALEQHPPEPSAHTAEPAGAIPAGVAAWNLGSFAEEQIRGLVHQLFLPGGLKAPRQVVISGVGPTAEVKLLCHLLGQVLAGAEVGTTCLVEVPLGASEEKDAAPRTGLGLVSCQKRFDSLRDASQQLSARLWFMPGDVFLGGNPGGISNIALRGRLAELRLEFDYTVLYATSGISSETAFLGSLCDGVVMVLQANSTRRVAARKAKERLSSANTRLLGTVLSQRTFPVPEAIYRRL